MKGTLSDGGSRETESFRSLGTLRVLNVLAVGFSLAGAAGVVLGHLFRSANLGLASALSTLVVGIAWARLLRSPKTVGKTQIRWGWLASIPLASLNAGAACAFLFASSEPDAIRGIFSGALLGATIGGIVWVPALVLTLVCFGLPIAWAQKRAKQGLTGEERGELVVGLISAGIACAGIALAIYALLTPTSQSADDFEPRWAAWHGLWWVIGALSLVGGLTGAIAAAFAKRREDVRRAFVRQVELGEVPNYRIDASPDGKVLVRVTSMGEGYRVANFEEPLIALDEEGEAQHPLALAMTRRP